MLRNITIGIIIGTAAIGSYYIIIPLYDPSFRESELSLELSKVEEGLSYNKFVEMSEQERKPLVERMSSRTIDLLIEEAKKEIPLFQKI